MSQLAQAFSPTVSIKGADEVVRMRVAGRLAAETLVGVDRMIRSGVTTGDIDRFVYQDTLQRGAWPAPLKYQGFPRSVCTSRNHVVCHGVPCDQEVLEPGDIINVDITSIVNGYHGDTSATFYIGEPSPEAQHVVEVARRSLQLGIAEVREGAQLGDIGSVIAEFVEAQGCSIVRRFNGHGIGRCFHEPPWVHHFGQPGTGLRMEAGMTFTIEPVVNYGKEHVDVVEGEWAVVTRDGSLSAQFEHTILVTPTGCEVLTRRAVPLLQSERFDLRWP